MICAPTAAVHDLSGHISVTAAVRHIERDQAAPIGYWLVREFGFKCVRIRLAADHVPAAIQPQIMYGLRESVTIDGRES